MKFPDECFPSTKALRASSPVIPFCWALPAICCRTSGVSVNPGQIALHIIFVRAYSRAIPLVKPTTPCLAATYATLSTDPTKPCVDAMFIIHPPAPWVSKILSACWLQRKGAVRFVSITAFQSSRDNNLIGQTHWIPALFTRISKRPNRWYIVSNRSCISAGLLRSAGW